MVGRELAEKILKEAMTYVKADGALITLSGGKNALTRFANNTIHQNVIKKDYVVRVLVHKGHRLGFASCNLFEGVELERIVRAAEEIARHQPEDPHFVPFPGAAQYRSTDGAYDDATIDAGPEVKGRAVAAFAKPAASEGLLCSGAFATGDRCVALMTTEGCFAYHAETGASLSLTVTTGCGATGWASHDGDAVGSIDPSLLYAKAKEKALMARNPVEIAPGRYTTILAPGAVKALVSYLAWAGLGGQSLAEGRSFLTGRIGEKITGDAITIVDDAYDEFTLGLPFDYEGSPRQTLSLIEKGVARGVAHDRRTAGRVGAETTGHALPYPSRWGPMPTNFRLEPGEATVDDMIASTEKGLFVSRFWYDNLVDPCIPILTGMTRDGTFLVEGGKIVGAVRNLRYNERLLEALGRTVAVGKNLQSFRGWATRVAAPASKIEDFHFTGCSKDVPA